MEIVTVHFALNNSLRYYYKRKSAYILLVEATCQGTRLPTNLFVVTFEFHKSGNTQDVQGIKYGRNLWGRKIWCWSFSIYLEQCYYNVIRSVLVGHQEIGFASLLFKLRLRRKICCIWMLVFFNNIISYIKYFWWNEIDDCKGMSITFIHFLTPYALLTNVILTDGIVNSARNIIKHRKRIRDSLRL